MLGIYRHEFKMGLCTNDNRYGTILSCGDQLCIGQGQDQVTNARTIACESKLALSQCDMGLTLAGGGWCRFFFGIWPRSLCCDSAARQSVTECHVRCVAEEGPRPGPARSCLPAPGADRARLLQSAVLRHGE